MMKRLLSFVIIALLFIGCKKDNNSIISDIDPFISANYTMDAQQLLFRMLQKGSVVTDKDKPEFNQNELNKILYSLQMVYQLKTTQTDSIFNIVKLHIYPFNSLQMIDLKIDPSSNEGKNLIAHQASGNAAFDNLLSKYGFAFYGNNLVFSTATYVFIKTAGYYNIPAFITAFKQFPFILLAEQDGSVGDGSDITYTLNGNGADIDFAIKSGDCPSGCIIRHGWRYHVDYSNGYRVTYLGSY